MPEGSAKYKTLQLQHNKNVFLGYLSKNYLGGGRYISFLWQKPSSKASSNFRSGTRRSLKIFYKFWKTFTNRFGTCSFFFFFLCSSLIWIYIF